MIYSEYLPRVDSVSVLLDFDEQVKDIKHVSLEAEDVLKLVATTEYKIELAHPVKQLKIQKLNVANGCLQMTLQIGDSDNGAVAKDESFLKTHVDKWSCQDIQRITKKTKFQFQCKYCSSILVDSQSYRFLDMPSEYWYEFMDYWHCHKPHNDEKYDKTYGELKPPNDHTVLLGDHYLLLDANNKLLINENEVLCKNCQNCLGTKNDANASLKLFKWKLQLAGESFHQEYPYQMFIYNLMVDKVNSHAIRKFSLEYNHRYWYFWVTNVGLDITINSKALKNTLKILYYESDNSSADSEYELLDIPADVRGEFIETITKRTKELPAQMQQVTMGSQAFSITNWANDEL